MNVKIVHYIIGILIVAFPLNAFGAGACCFPNGNCSINNDEFDCEEGIGNIWQGDNTVCQPNPCPQQQSTAIPSLNEWGMIIFVTLAGLGAIYFIRRNKRTES
jgi:hypothetical protein